MLSLKKHELFITQSKNAAIKPTAPTIIANITKFKLDKIIATKSAIEKNINPINQGHLTNLFKNIANIMATNITAKNISIVIFIPFLSIYLCSGIFYDPTYISVTF